MTFGIIFYEINNKSIYLYLQRNSYEIYQDILINESINVNVSYYIKIYDYDHIIYLLDKNKYNELFKIYEKKLEKINYNIFNQKIFHNNIKHKRIKNIQIKNQLDFIILNNKLRIKLNQQ